MLEEINETRARNAEAKKEYVAALSLNNREVLEAVRDSHLGASIVSQNNHKLQHSQSSD